MGYFNYFIKCIIRNIARIVCKPKFLFAILLFGAIFIGLKNYGYCSIDNVVTVSPSAPNYNSDGTTTGHTQFDNIYLNLRTMQEQQQLSLINRLYAASSVEPENTKKFVELLFSELTIGHNAGKGFYVFHSGSGANSYQFKVYIYFKGGLSYSQGYGNYTFNGTTYQNVSYYTGSMFFLEMSATNDYTFVSGYETVNIPAAFLDVTIPEWIQLFKDFGCVTSATDSAVLSKLDELIEQSQSQDAQIAEKIEQGNQLQQEQNQLQQEQNDFLKQESSDDDVSVDGFNSIDSNDITSAGLTGVFTNIYNSITSWSSKDIKLPIPYTNENIVIPANYTENMLNSFGGSWVVTFIHSIYYFIVARFIIYSITGIINSIKSGSILETDSKNNITTDML